MNYDSNADSGYCCSGINHKGGNGPIANGDCPADAIAAQKSTVHSCVISKKKGISFVDSAKFRGIPQNSGFFSISFSCGNSTDYLAQWKNELSNGM